MPRYAKTPVRGRGQGGGDVVDYRDSSIPRRGRGPAVKREQNDDAPFRVVLRQYAQEYTLDGLPVIPVRQKVANVLREWNPYKTRLPTDDEITGFPWHRADGLALVISDALYETLGNVWLLDIEVEHRAEAEQWLDRNVPGWRDGMNVESGSGGLHGYYVASKPDPLGKSQSPMRWGHLKLHNALGYLPPTKHPKGGEYRWLSRGKPIPLEPDTIPGVDTERRPVREIIEAGPITEENPGRNQTLFRLGCLLRGNGFDPSTIAVVLNTVNNERCEPPLDRQEVDKIATSIAERYRPNPTIGRVGRTDRPRYGRAVVR